MKILVAGATTVYPKSSTMIPVVTVELIFYALLCRESAFISDGNRRGIHPYAS